MVRVGDVVMYRLTHADVLRIQHQREACSSDLFDGADVLPGSVCPMVITKVVPDAYNEETILYAGDGTTFCPYAVEMVSGHVLLDGNDSLRAANVANHPELAGCWFPR